MSSILSSIAMVTTGLVIFGYVAIVGGAVAFFGACIRVLIFRKLPVRLSMKGAEAKFLIASSVAAILGSAWLFLAPAYGGSRCAFSSSDAVVTTTRESKVGPNGEIFEVIRSSSKMIAAEPADGDCTVESKTFYEKNGTRVIPLFTVPILFTLLPVLFCGWRVRPIIEAFLAFLLGGQMVIGMSLYGAAFGPSAVFMLLAALAALRTEVVAKQPGKAV